MKRILTIAFSVIMLAGLTLGQQGSVDHIDFDPHPVPIAVGNVTARVFGTPGTTTCTYWVDAVYKGTNPLQGETPPAGPVSTSQCPGVLNASNYVRIMWHPSEAAQSYNVFKTVTAPATGSILLGNTTQRFLDDTGQALTAWTKPTAYPRPVVPLAAKDGVLVLPFGTQVENSQGSGGGPGGGGSNVGGSSTAINGDGNFFPNTIPSTSSGGVKTFNITPNAAPVNTAWLGPQGDANTNVGVTNVTNCPFNQPSVRVASYTCAQTSESFAVGDRILIIWGRQFNTSSTTFSDTLGTTFTVSAYGAAAGTAQLFAFGTVTTAGKDTVSVTNIDEHFENAGTEYFNFQIVHLTGATSVTNSVSRRTSGAVSSMTNSIVPVSSTDALIRLAFWSDSGTPSTTVTYSPVGTIVKTFNNSTVPATTGATDIFGPGSTSLLSTTATFSPGSTGTGVGYFLLVEVAQSSTAGSGPGHYGTISPNYLTQAAKSTVQSVTEFHMASSPINLPSATNTTVITGSVTMPSSGCPCRALVQGGIFWTASPNGSTADGWWFSDGTNTFGWQVRVPTDSASDAAVSSATSPVSYSNNQSVTFSFVFNPGTYAGTTIQAVDNISPPLPAAAHSWMKITILPSIN